MILAMAVMMPLVMACGGDNDEPNGPNGGGGGSGSGSDEKPDTSLFAPRNGITDGDGVIFWEKGKMITANTNFTQADLEQALSKISWKNEKKIMYDKNYISVVNAFNDDRRLLPKYLIDGIAKFNELGEREDSPRKYKMKGKAFVVDMDLLSSSWEDPVTYRIIALYLANDSTSYMITDRVYPIWGWRPKWLDFYTMTVRILWKPLLTQ